MEYPNAGAFCQGALPAFAGTLRTRPLAIVNEGNVPAFVTCSFSGGFSSRFTLIAPYIINNGSVSRNVTCTLVDGYQASSVSARYVSKTVEVAAGDSELLSFVPADVSGSTYITYPNLSCSLPAGTGVTYVMTYYLEAVGS